MSDHVWRQEACLKACAQVYVQIGDSLVSGADTSLAQNMEPHPIWKLVEEAVDTKSVKLVDPEEG